MADRLRGEPVEVAHQVHQDGELSIGPAYGGSSRADSRPIAPARWRLGPVRGNPPGYQHGGGVGRSYDPGSIPEVRPYWHRCVYEPT
jgi:hypothetical protein